MQKVQINEEIKFILAFTTWNEDSELRPYAAETLAWLPPPVLAHLPYQI